tara:strand:- start:6614 stop:7459 length:846 start_codon:yes stop_codon:yes gene_type:complete
MLKINYPDKQSRFKAFVRPLLLIPIYFMAVILLNTIAGKSDITRDPSIAQKPINSMLSQSGSVQQIKQFHQDMKNFFLKPAPIHLSINDEHIQFKIPEDIPGNVNIFLTGVKHLWKLSPVNIFTPFSGILFFPLVISLLFRTYPRWWYTWNVEMTMFLVRITAYAMLLTDKYPALDKAQNIKVKIPRPHNHLHPLLPLLKIFLALPHWLVIFFLIALSTPTLIISWLSIVILGWQPKWIFNFHTGIIRYKINIMAYCVLLVTDKYPSFTITESRNNIASSQ